jgi:hypothetical protein
MNTEHSTPAHDDGLEWLRDVRRKMFADAGGDLKKLGDRYRATQAQYPQKQFDPHDTIIKAIKARGV